jgi:hypothetical protein
MWISGMEFFTDAYDLFIIGVVMALVNPFGLSAVFPLRVRTTGHGIAAAAGKLGGFFGVFVFRIFCTEKDY